MYLDEVENIPASMSSDSVDPTRRREVYEKWADWHASDISHHSQICCEIAREWITATDLSELAGGSRLTGPRWLRQKFLWGPSEYPIYWCEAVQKDTLDCGVLAALAYEVFLARGINPVRVQMIQRFSEVATFQWSNSWADGEPLRWTDDDLIYHEGCAIPGPDGELQIWDASAGWWIDPKVRDGYGALLALRISGPRLRDTTFQWGSITLPVFRWVDLHRMASSSVIQEISPMRGQPGYSPLSSVPI